MTDHQTPTGLQWLTRNPDLAGLAAIAFVVSYLHGLEVVQAAGSTGPVAYMVPLVADLLIIGSSRALLDAANKDERRPWLAALSLVASIAVTVAMNVAAGVRHGLGGALVSVLAPLAFVAAYEILLGRIRRARKRALGQAVGGHAEPCTHTIAESPDEGAVQWFLHARDCLGMTTPRYGQRAIAEKWPVGREKLRLAVAEYDTRAVKDSLTTAVQPPSGAQLNGHAQIDTDKVATS